MMYFSMSSYEDDLRKVELICQNIIEPHNLPNMSITCIK